MVFVVLEMIRHKPVPLAVVAQMYEMVWLGIERPMAVPVTLSV